MNKKLLVIVAASMFSGSAAHAQLPSYVPSAGLKMYLPFNGNALDASGNGNNGIVNNCTLTSGEAGLPNTAYQFNGTTSFIRVRDTGSLRPQQVTLSAKVYPMGFYDGHCHSNILISKGAPDGQTGNYSLRYISSTNSNCAINDTLTQNFAMGLHTGAPLSTINTTPYMRTNMWYSVVGTYDGSYLKMYVNGELRHQYQIIGSVGTNYMDVLIGKFDDIYYPYWFKGKIDDVGIWDRALTSCEISRLANSGLIATQPTNQYATMGNTASFSLSSPILTGVSYQWQMSTGGLFTNLSNGGQFSGVTTNTLTVSAITDLNQNQSFRCLVSAAAGCTDTSSAARLITNVGVNAVHANGNILFQNYPNPAKSGTTIKYHIASMKRDAHVNVSDIQGKKLLTKEIKKSGDGTIQLDHLSAGVYVYELIVDGTKVSSKKMVILE